MIDWWNCSYLQVNQSIWTAKELLYGHGHILLKRIGTKSVLETQDVTNLVPFTVHVNSMYLKKTSVSRKASLAFILSTICQHPFATILTNPSEAAHLQQEIINAVSCTLNMFHNNYSCRMCNSTTTSRPIQIVGVFLQWNWSIRLHLKYFIGLE